MANRYWVGGSGNWSDNTNHWSDSSDGSPGASLPTSSDDVFIDENSGFDEGGTIHLQGDVFVHDFICNSGHTYEIERISTFSYFHVSGDLYLDADMVWNVACLQLDDNDESEKTVTTNGVQLYFMSIGGVST